MMKKFTHSELQAIPERRYAVRSHENVGESKDTYGHHPSPEAIGGFYGIRWLEVFRDNAGNLYKVRCHDGVYSSDGPYYIRDGHADYCTSNIEDLKDPDEHCNCMSEEELELLAGNKTFNRGFTLDEVVKMKI